MHMLEMLHNVVIKPIPAGIYTPALLVPKMEGSIHFVADLRDMNKILEEDVYPLLLIQDVLDEIDLSALYFIVDLRSTF